MIKCMEINRIEYLPWWGRGSPPSLSFLTGVDTMDMVDMVEDIAVEDIVQEEVDMHVVVEECMVVRAGDMMCRLGTSFYCCSPQNFGFAVGFPQWQCEWLHG
jgi:hypothetical protein